MKLLGRSSFVGSRHPCLTSVLNNLPHNDQRLHLRRKIRLQLFAACPFNNSGHYGFFDPAAPRDIVMIVFVARTPVVPSFLARKFRLWGFHPRTTLDVG